MKTNNIFKLLISLTFFTILAGCNFPTNTNTNSSSSSTSSTTTATVDSFVGTWRYSYTSNNNEYFTDYTYNSDGTGISLISSSNNTYSYSTFTWELLPNNQLRIVDSTRNILITYSFRNSAELFIDYNTGTEIHRKLNYTENDFYGSWSYTINTSTYVYNFQNNKTVTFNTSNNTTETGTWDFLPNSKIQITISNNGQNQQLTYFYRIVNSKLYLYTIRSATEAALWEEFTKA